MTQTFDQFIEQLRQDAYRKGWRDREQLAAGQPAMPSRRATLQRAEFGEKIIEACCIYFGISNEELVSSKRHREIVVARQSSMYLMRMMTSMTVLAIGKRFNRDHTTVIHSQATISDLIQTNAHLKADIDHMHELLTRMQVENNIIDVEPKDDAAAVRVLKRHDRAHKIKRTSPIVVDKKEFAVSIAPPPKLKRLPLYSEPDPVTIQFQRPPAHYTNIGGRYVVLNKLNQAL